MEVKENYQTLRERVLREGLIPDPLHVGEFLKVDNKDKTRFLYPNSWVFHKDVVSRVLAGDYEKITPFNSEFVATMNCTNRCKICGYKSAKKLDGSWKRNDCTNPRIHMPNAEFAKDLVDKLHEGGVKGITFTGGGEPTMFRGLEETMEHVSRIGMDMVLYSNGNSISPERIRRIVEAKPLLVRISLNAGTEEVYNQFHSPLAPNGAFQRTLRTIEEFARGSKRNPAMTFGIGIVVNEINQDDLLEAALRVREISDKVDGGIEFIMYRPEFDYYDSVQLAPELLDKTCDIIDEKVIPAMKGSGIRISNVRSRFKALKEDTKTYTECRGTGPFGEVSPRGKMFLCCDRNMNPSYEIGDLTQSSFLEVHHGEERKYFLEWIKRNKCRDCPPACKSHELNKQFEDVEKFRKSGEMYKVQLWAEMFQQMPAPKMVNF